MFPTKICPKCGREYMCPPAISRDDNETEICPVCGTAEAIEPFSEDVKTKILVDIEKIEIEKGRVKQIDHGA